MKRIINENRSSEQISLLSTIKTFEVIWERGDKAHLALNRNLILHGASNYNES